MQARLKIQENRPICEMTDSMTPKNVECMIIKKSMETPSPQKEDSSMDEWSSVKSSISSSYSTDESFFLCASCRAKKFESRSEISSEDDGSNNTYNISDTDFYSTGDTTSGSGYISMDSISSIDDSGKNSEEGSDSSCYYCDRSASSSSSMDIDDSYSETSSRDDSNFRENVFLEIEE